MEICGDNRFEIIAKAKADLLDATNIDTSEDEMKVLDNFLFRCWQMGWLDRYAEQTENSSEIPNNCEPQTERIKTLDYCDICNHKGCDNCIANNLDDYCVPSNFEEAVKDKPQLKEDGELEILTQTIEFPDTQQRFIFTRSIRADGDCLIVGDWEYKGKEDEPQTERSE